jgi:hypothetical protein
MSKKCARHDKCVTHGVATLSAGMPGPGQAVAIFTAIQAWNEFLFGLTMTTGGPLACR